MKFSLPRAAHGRTLDHVVVLGERHLRRILTAYFAYYHRTRTHLSLEKDAPDGRHIEPPSLGRGPRDSRSRWPASPLHPAGSVSNIRPASPLAPAHAGCSHRPSGSFWVPRRIVSPPGKAGAERRGLRAS